jgi:hypothetical protein
VDEHWFQDLIVCSRKIGISKKELLEDYYYDEIGSIFDRYAEISKPGDENSGGEMVYSENRINLAGGGD